MLGNYGMKLGNLGVKKREGFGSFNFQMRGFAVTMSSFVHGVRCCRADEDMTARHLQTPIFNLIYWEHSIPFSFTMEPI